MTPPPPSRFPERIDLREVDDPRDVVHQVVAALAQGGIVALADEGELTLLAGALQPNGAQALLDWERSEPRPVGPVLLIRSPAESLDWAPALGRVGSRLARRGWPGPLILTVAGAGEAGMGRLLGPAIRSAFRPEGALSLRAPEHPFLRDVLRLTPGPVLSARVKNDFRVGDEQPSRGCAMVIEGLTEELGEPATEVTVEKDSWTITRQGVVTEPELTRLAGTIILFVCTGNTCRSPMAEALCKVQLARKLGCAPSGLERKGYVVLSAGISAISGMPAAANAVAAVGKRGGDLDAHASRRLTPSLARQADHILAMTSDHLEALVGNVPEIEGRTSLLHPAGDDVADPVGSDLLTYQRAAEAIESYLAYWIDRLVV